MRYLLSLFAMLLTGVTVGHAQDLKLNDREYFERQAGGEYSGIQQQFQRWLQ